MSRGFLCLIGNVQCECLIDSRADISLINPQLLEALSKTTVLQQEQSSQRTTVLGGGTVEIKARCVAAVKIGETTTKQEFCVVQMSSQCLLRGDFLRKYNCVINYKDMVLTVDKAEIPMELVESRDTPQVFRVVFRPKFEIETIYRNSYSS